MISTRNTNKEKLINLINIIKERCERLTWYIILHMIYKFLFLDYKNIIFEKKIMSRRVRYILLLFSTFCIIKRSF